MIYNTLAHIGDAIPCQVAWLGSDRKPLEVQNVEATLFHYVEDVRTVLTGPTQWKLQIKLMVRVSLYHAKWCFGANCIC